MRNYSIFSLTVALLTVLACENEQKDTTTSTPVSLSFIGEWRSHMDGDYSWCDFEEHIITLDTISSQYLVRMVKYKDGSFDITYPIESWKISSDSIVFQYGKVSYGDNNYFRQEEIGREQVNLYSYKRTAYPLIIESENAFNINGLRFIRSTE